MSIFISVGTSAEDWTRKDIFFSGMEVADTVIEVALCAGSSDDFCLYIFLGL